MIAVIFRDNLPSFIFCVMLLISAGLNQALAAVDPKPLPADTRMGELIYDADQIFRIHSALGIATHIILAPGEKIVSSAAGQPADCRLQESAWCIVALVGTDELYIQPRLAGPARNNLQLTTNLRRYSFEFIHAPRAGEAAPFWFRVTFRYPGQRLAATATPTSKLVTLTMAEALQFHVPADYTVFPHQDIDLEHAVVFDRSLSWSSALPDSLRALGIDMTLDARTRRIQLLPVHVPPAILQH